MQEDKQRDRACSQRDWAIFLQERTLEDSRLSAFLWIPSLSQQITVINTTLFASSHPFFYCLRNFTDKEKKKDSTLCREYLDTKQPWSEDYLITKMHLTTVAAHTNCARRALYIKPSKVQCVQHKQKEAELLHMCRQCLTVQWGLSTI